MKRLSLRQRVDHWVNRNWFEIKMEVMSACMGLCFLMLIVLMAAMVVEGLSIGH
ncbi:MAG: hypothetical protein KCHDKBKB_01072 [Elusimicrobia bacterium]|nr:hypothetical protein [Elusimicrobiota bacterium]